MLDKADYPDFDEETGILPKEDDEGFYSSLVTSIAVSFFYVGDVF